MLVHLCVEPKNPIRCIGGLRSGGMSPQRHKGTKKGRDSLCNKDVTSCFFDKVFGTLTRRFAAPSPGGRGIPSPGGRGKPSPGGRGTFCRRVLLPLGEGLK